MDKYVQRKRTWKTMNYATITATAAQRKEHPNADGAVKRQPLQEYSKINAQHTNDVDTSPIIKMKHMDLLAEFTSHKTGETADIRDNLKLQSNASSVLKSQVEEQQSKCRLSLKFGTPLGKTCVNITSETEHIAAQKADAVEVMTSIEPSRKLVTSSSAPICCNSKLKTSSDGNIESITPKPQRFDRLQNDLNSPSASVRVRAMRALNCPTKTVYNAFDVPHAEQSLVFDKDHIPEVAPTIKEIFNKVIVFVEVRTGQDDRSEGVKSIISKLGAQVNDRLLRNTTHVIFKDGRHSTYNKAINWNIPIVSILWIEACKIQCKLCNPEKFPISNKQLYEYPELFPKLPRTRYMQPDSELNRHRKRHCTPTRAKESDTDLNSGKKANKPISTPTPSTPVLNNNKNASITDFFKPTAYNKQICSINEEWSTESPGTKLLNRISNGLFMSAQKSNSSIHKSDKEEPKNDNVNDESNLIQKSITQGNLSFNENTGGDTPTLKRRSSITTTERITRRRSLLQIASETPEPRITERATRRRSSLHIASSLTEKASIETPELRITERATRRRSSLHIASNLTEKASIETPEPRITERATRRRSSLQISSIETPELRITERATRRRSSLQITNISTEIITPQPCMTHRRSNSQLAANTVLDPNVAKRSLFQTVVEEPMAEAVENKTNYLDKSLEMSGLRPLDKKSSFKTAVESVMKNRTNCAEKSLQISGVQSDVNLQLAKRATVNSIASMEFSSILSNSSSTSKSYQSVDSENLNKTESIINKLPNISSQTSSCSTADGEHTPVPVFSSTRLPNSASSNRRRTIYNMDLEFVKERINSINNIAQRRSIALLHELDNLEEGKSIITTNEITPQAVPVTTDKTVQTNEPEPQQPKMRKLFVPNDEIIVTPPKSTKRSRLSVSGTPSCDSMQKRRRTLAVPIVHENTNGKKNTISLPTQRNEECNSVYLKPVGRRSTLDFEQPNKHAGPKNSAMKTNIEVVGDNNCGHPLKQSEDKTSADQKPPKNASTRNIRNLVHTNMHQTQIQVIYQTMQKLRGVRLERVVTKRTTHLVSLEPRRTLNLLRGLIRGVWILDYRWILDSLRAGKWVNEEPYEMTSFSRSVEICRIERQAFGIQYRCDLFKYMESFFVSTQCRPIPYDSVKELLLLGGAKLTDNRFKARYIIGDKQRVEDDRIYLNPNWLLDSIMAMQIQKFGKYLMKCAIVTPVGIRYEVANIKKIE